MQKMRGLLKFLFSLLLIALIGGAGAWFWAGRMDGPTIEISRASSSDRRARSR
jgi:hypothetical protein